MSHDVLLGYLDSESVSSSFDSSKMRLIVRDLQDSKHLKGWAEMRTHALGLPTSRNNLCKQVLESEQLKWLFMVDSDMGFEETALDQMMATADPIERPVIGGLCFSQRELKPDGMGGFFTFCAPTILQYLKHDDGVHRFTGVDHYPVNSLVRAGATGAAFILIHRSVLERVKEEFGETWFDQQCDEGGGVQSEDISFCERLYIMGIPLYVDTGIRTTHSKTQWVCESDYWMHKLAPPADEAVDVIVPVLHRPQNILTFMRSLRASTGLATAWFVCEPDDLEEQKVVTANGGNVLKVSGTFAKKVNYAYSKTKAPWVLLVGDDVRFRPAWLDQALDIARRYHANVVGTNDLANDRVTRGEHATHMLIRRSYIKDVGASWDGPGKVAHEGYNHWYVDDEICTAAKMRGTFQAALGSYVEHLHPIVGKAEMDDVYRMGQSDVEEDQKRFEARLTRALVSEGEAPTGGVEVPGSMTSREFVGV